jgi:hypothetical protein
MRDKILLAIGIAVALVSCTTNGASDTFNLVEFAVDGPAHLDSNIGSVLVTNSGAFSHTLVVTDSNGGAVTATPLLHPGESVVLDLDLKPGTYSFTCRIVVQTDDGELIDHFERGMASTVEVRG